MKTFTTIEEAFGWFLDNVYKNLPAEEKKGELTNAWRNYTHKLGISPKKMAAILERYGFEVKLLVTYKK
ncbi:hypothetical protein [Dyadobacter sp. CY323]|uniref:hypothetical protein n=1 Tax=Dyadobacter sp. CY323 TaxID=2907302 RepID=UPI001F334F2E|nr:hypothetical protein [Dyadobacter sp. CY323]MCE6989915.1 hypothetical protein [Dyadobacter sp. CY323]